MERAATRPLLALEMVTPPKIPVNDGRPWTRVIVPSIVLLAVIGVVAGLFLPPSSPGTPQAEAQTEPPLTEANAGETCRRLSAVNGSRRQPAHRSRSAIPASCAIRSNSAGHA